MTEMILLLSWLSLFNIGLAAADVELTQRCLEKQVCHEANPFMPDSRSGMYAVKSISLVPMVIWYERTKSPKAKWILIGTLVVQGVVVGIGLKNQ